MSDHHDLGAICTRSAVGRWLLLLAVTLALGVLPGRAVADRVGVVVVVSVNLSEGTVHQLSEEIATAVRDSLEVDVIAGEEVARRLPSRGVSDTCPNDPACVADVAERLGVDYLLWLAMVRVGRQIQVDPVCMEVDSGRILSKERILLDSHGAAASEVFRAAAPRLMPKVRVRALPARSTQPALLDAADSALPKDPVLPITTITLVESTPPPRSPIPTEAWIAGGVGALSLMAASIFAVEAHLQYDNLEARGCKLMPCNPTDIEHVRIYTTAADALFGVGVAAGIAATLFYYYAGEESEQMVGLDARSNRVTVTVGGAF